MCVLLFPSADGNGVVVLVLMTVMMARMIPGILVVVVMEGGWRGWK